MKKYLFLIGVFIFCAFCCEQIFASTGSVERLPDDKVYDGIDVSGGPGISWKLAVNTEGDTVFRGMVIKGDSVYLTLRDNERESLQIVCCDYATGSLKWERVFEKKEDSIIQEDKIYIHADSGEVLVVDSVSGQDMEIIHIDDWTSFVSRVNAYWETDSIYYGYAKGVLTVYDQKDSEVISRIYGGAINSPAPVRNENSLFFGTYSGLIYAIDFETGKEKWKHDLEQRMFYTSLFPDEERLVFVWCPVAEDKLVSGDTIDIHFTVLSTEDGSVIIDKTFPTDKVVSWPIVKDGFLYIAFDDAVEAYSVEDLSKVWSYDFNDVIFPALRIYNDSIVITSGREVSFSKSETSRVVSLNRLNGTLLWETAEALGTSCLPQVIDDQYCMVDSASGNRENISFLDLVSGNNSGRLVLSEGEKIMRRYNQKALRKTEDGVIFNTKGKESAFFIYRVKSKNEEI